jgi:hypothetical protein
LLRNRHVGAEVDRHVAGKRYLDSQIDSDVGGVRHPRCARRVRHDRAVGGPAVANCLGPAVVAAGEQRHRDQRTDPS